MDSLAPLAISLSRLNLIEASAGTGKTHTITTFFVRLLVEAELEAKEILVVTFTEAATAELRDRVRRRLRAVYDGEAGDELAQVIAGWPEPRLSRARQTIARALHGFDEASIFTIHGFCQRVLHEHAFESGISFDAEVEADPRPLLEEVVRDFWAATLYEASPDLVRLLGARRLDVVAFTQLATRIASRPDAVLLPDAAAGDKTIALQHALARFVRDELPRRKEARRVHWFDDLLASLDRALGGAAGGRLVEKLRRRYPAALIDEFQDTDPVQYRIFSRLYAGSENAVFLIGDPKQAIYAFRGADVFAYLDAARDAADRAFTLDVNWRSDPKLIRAVNLLFSRAPKPFVFDDIAFKPVVPRPGAQDKLQIGGEPASPLQIRFVSRGGRTGHKSFINKDWAREHLGPMVAGDVSRLLERGTLGERRIEAADVAILVRTHDQAKSMQDALRELGIPSVLQSAGSVFASPEATELARLLAAIAEPIDAGLVRAALATDLLGLGANEIQSLLSDERGWDNWASQFRAWHDQWNERGFIQTFRAVLAFRRDDAAPAVHSRLLALRDGERRLTNLLHAAELMHAAARSEHLGMAGLIRWLERQRLEAELEQVKEPAELRLESDEKAVRLVTIHASKGLEYPVVYCPFLWEAAELHKNDRSCLVFHDAADGRRLKLDLAASGSGKRAAERELFAESLRLLYVALTRAQHLAVVVWGGFNGAPRSALAHLLHPGEDAAADDDGMRAALEALATASNGAIGVGDLEEAPAAFAREEEAPEVPLHARRFTRRLDTEWRISSFSALTSQKAGPDLHDGRDRDDAAVEVTWPSGALAGAQVLSRRVDLHDLPASAVAGRCIHAIFEEIDFVSAGDREIEEKAEEKLAAFGLEAERWAAPLGRAIAAVLDTSLSPDSPDLRLRGLASSRKLVELPFAFPVESVVSATRLADCIRKHSELWLPPNYADEVAKLGFEPVRGFLKGYVDLVFEHGGRWYIVDYKSNFLGPSYADYAPARLREAMAHHHYFLQSYVYSVALHRYLATRLRGYSAIKHFGGILYLFVRGMSPEIGPRAGVFRCVPSARLVEDLSRLFGGARR